jgi:hypothetical protein
MPRYKRTREPAELPAKLARRDRASRTASKRTSLRCGKQRNSHEREGCLYARSCDEPDWCKGEHPEDGKRWTILLGVGESRAKDPHFIARGMRRRLQAGTAVVERRLETRNINKQVWTYHTDTLGTHRNRVQDVTITEYFIDFISFPPSPLNSRNMCLILKNDEINRNARFEFLGERMIKQVIPRLVLL